MADEKKLDLGISIPEEMIKNLIAGAVTKSLGNAESLIEHIVLTAFDAKSSSSYGQKTIFQESLEKMIRERATEAMHEWLKQNDVKLKAAFKQALNRSQAKLLADFTERLEKGWCSVDVSGVTLSLTNDR